VDSRRDGEGKERTEAELDGVDDLVDDDLTEVEALQVEEQ
jgi:hypothetical protein